MFSWHHYLVLQYLFTCFVQGWCFSIDKGMWPKLHMQFTSFWALSSHILLWPAITCWCWCSPLPIRWVSPLLTSHPEICWSAFYFNIVRGVNKRYPGKSCKCWPLLGCASHSLDSPPHLPTHTPRYHDILRFQPSWQFGSYHTSLIPVGCHWALCICEI